MTAIQSFPRSTTSTSSSSTTTAAASPSFSQSNIKINRNIAKIKDFYLQAIGRCMPALIADEVMEDLRAGTPAWYYEYALKHTAMAPMPSWRYAQAILRRIKREGMTYEEFLYE